MTEPAEEGALSPEVWAHLEASLDTYQREHESHFQGPEGPEEAKLHEAMGELRKRALDLLTTGRLPPDLEDRISAYQPGAHVENKILDLLQYNVVQHRIEFDVAWEVIGRLRSLGQRVAGATFALALLLRSDPSETAVKYFRKAATLFLAGYDSEVAVMCGAVLEAAIRTRIPDAVLQARGIRPAHRRTGDYSLKQRMEYETMDPFLDAEQRDRFWNVINWRNDAVHVQPDLSPDPALPLLHTSKLLGAILPRSLPI